MYMSKKDDNQPKKKVSKSKKPDKNELVDESEAEEKIFRNKIKAAIEANLSEYASKKNLSQKQICVINSFIEEHLSCFVLLGYSVKGEPVSLINAPTQQDSDALGTLLQKFLVKYIDPPPQSTLF